MFGMKKPRKPDTETIESVEDQEKDKAAGEVAARAQKLGVMPVAAVEVDAVKKPTDGAEDMKTRMARLRGMRGKKAGPMGYNPSAALFRKKSPEDM